MKRIWRLLKCRRGAAAVEFAIIAPFFLMVLLTMIAYGFYLSAASSVQQIAADAARTAVAGLSNTERVQLAQDFVRNSTLNHAFLKKEKFQVSVTQDPNNSNQFMVSVDYDASDLPIWNLFAFTLPDHQIRRFATIRLGGI